MTTDDTAVEPAEQPAAEYVSKQDAADRLGISTRQLDRLVQAGRVQKYRRPVGRFKVSYRVADLDKLTEPATAND